jgi:hypothetical protein
MKKVPRIIWIIAPLAVLVMVLAVVKPVKAPVVNESSLALAIPEETGEKASANAPVTQPEANAPAVEAAPPAEEAAEAETPSELAQPTPQAGIQANSLSADGGKVPTALPVTGGLMIPVTGAAPVHLDCAGDLKRVFILPLVNNNQVRISGLCVDGKNDYWVSLLAEETETLPASPEQYNFHGGITVRIVEGKSSADLQLVKKLPGGVSVKYLFEIPEWRERDQYVGMFWSGKEWIQKSASAIDNMLGVTMNAAGTVILGKR